MEETNCCWIGTTGRGRKLRKSAENVRHWKRIRLALRSSWSGQWWTTEWWTQFGSGCSSSSRFNGPLLPSSGRCCSFTETFTLSSVSEWRRSTGSNGRFIDQSHLNVIASTGQSATAFSRFKSTFNFCIGWFEFISGCFGHFVLVPTN